MASQEARPPTPDADSDHSIDSNDSVKLVNGSFSPVQSINELVFLVRSIENGDLSNEDGIRALPRRRSKPQRPQAIELSKALYPELTDIASIIKYENIRRKAVSTVRQIQEARVAASIKNHARILQIQGPWAGQEVDPVDLKGPAAIPMPVEIGKVEDFAPIFGFLANESFDAATRDGLKPNVEFVKRNEEYTGNITMIEFPRGIIYKDGRLDLCKKVVGPTHIGKLMESLEHNVDIRQFLLGNNAISTTGAKSIADFIRKYPNRMETWYVAGCHITRHGLSLLVPQMITSTSITNLWFKRNPFGPNSSNLLATLVLQTPNLRTLDLETTELGDEGARKFIEAITSHPSALRNLYLNANGIGESACASIGTYLADTACKISSLFLSTNPIGDAGMRHLAPGIAKNKTLKRFMCSSSGLTSKGLSYLASALAGKELQLQSIDIGVSQTTKAHGMKFNYFDDAGVEALKTLIMLPSLRWLNVGGTKMSDTAVDAIKAVAARSELVYFNMHRVHDGSGAPTIKSCSLELRQRLAANQAKYFPAWKDYKEFLKSEDLRFLRNTRDVRLIDSMYRTQDKRLGLPGDVPWKEGDETWKLIVEDARRAEVEDGAALG